MADPAQWPRPRGRSRDEDDERGPTTVPTYQYTCTDCAEPLEVQQSFSDASLTTCPVCEGRLRKVFNAVGVVFKGSGFYRNDSRATDGEGGSQESSDAASNGSGKDSANGSGKGSDSGSGKDSANGGDKRGGADRGADRGSDRKAGKAPAAGSTGRAGTRSAGSGSGKPTAGSGSVS